MRREVILVVGKTGYGKSEWARKFLQGKNRVLVFDPMGQMPADYRNADALLDFYDAPETMMSEANFCVGTTNPDDVDLLARIAYVVGHCWLVLEEISTVFNRGENLPDWARDAIFLGRHPHVNIMMIAQRAATAPIALRSQITRLIAFAQHEKTDVNYLAEIVGRDAAEQLPELPFYTCLDYWPALTPPLARYKA